MKTLLLIGMGSGDPQQITVQAIQALNRTSVFFVLDKGKTTDDLVRLRLEICERYIREPGYRVVQVTDPKRDSATAPYTQGVEDWHEQRAEVFARLIEDELAQGECGAFLLWGEPALYDSTLRILDRVRANGCTAVSAACRRWWPAIEWRSMTLVSRSVSRRGGDWWPRTWTM